MEARKRRRLINLQGQWRIATFYRMKRFTFLVTVFCLAFAWRAHAQTPKWSFTVDAPPGTFVEFVEQSVFDGSGGSAWNIVFNGTQDDPAGIAWLDLNGRPIYTNVFSNASLWIARFTRTQLAVQVRVFDRGTGAVTTNYMLLIRKSAKGVTTSQFPIGFGERTRGYGQGTPGLVGAPSDIRGLFTSEVLDDRVILRRYTN